MDIRSKAGRSATDLCVINNINSLKVLVSGGAKTESTLKLARDYGRWEMVAYLESVQKCAREDEIKTFLKVFFLPSYVFRPLNFIKQLVEF